MNDPRTQKRLRRRLTVSFGDRLPAVTADVSPGGFAAQMAGVFVPGSSLHGTLTVSGRPLPFQGEVTWARPGDPRTSTHSRFGVRFTRVPEGFEELLASAGRGKRRS